MSEFPSHAILQRDGRTYAVVPRLPRGLVTPAQLEAIARVAREHAVPALKITSGQRIALVGIEPERVDAACAALGMDLGPAEALCVHYVQACPGTDFCRFGVQDSMGLGLRLEELLVGRELPAKAKLGVSGCPFCCAESRVRDLGVVGKKNGWTVVVGGNSGNKPRIGDVLAVDLDAAAVVDLAGRFLDHYAGGAKKKERSSRFVERVGIDAIQAALGVPAGIA